MTSARSMLGCVRDPGADAEPERWGADPRLEALLGAQGAAGCASVFDVTDFGAVEAGVDAVGRVDVLVNNAGNAGAEGFGSRGVFAQTEPADWEPYPGMVTHWGKIPDAPDRDNQD